MDMPTIFTLMGCTFAIVAVMISMFLWNRSEANMDRRDMVKLIQEIHDEMTDFHTRLVEVEKRK